MTVFRKRSKFLLCGSALPMLCSASVAEAGLLSTLIGKTTQVVSSVTGAVTGAVAQTTTTTGSTVVSVVPLPTNVVNPLAVTVSSTPGSTTNTVTAVGSVGDNALSDPSYLLPGENVFSAPDSGELSPRGGKIRSFAGKIRSFTNDGVSPFWGKIRSFWGEVGPFEGDTAQFWGELRNYNDGSDPKRVEPLGGKIRSFWDELGSSWIDVRAVWDTSDYVAATNGLKGVVDKSARFWGDAVKAETGKDFRSGFANALLARFGIDLNDPSSLAKLAPNERELFFLEWYDGLMEFSGADHADYWMRQINWTPALTQVSGKGKDSVIGLLDFTVNDSSGTKIKEYKGVSTFDNGHGAAVASLMVAAHDGKGVMGIAPMASVVAYNPFDASETAGWADIKEGIVTLGKHKASIINMSLGVPGWTLHPDWNAVLADPAVALQTSNTVFVIAAGNDGITQTKDIAWSNSASFIVVGSVDPGLEISGFSNRPGKACLLTDGKCLAGDALMNHYIVAPGEMLLMSDGKGGVTRYSGTSFAAPLVSGTVALIHDRWPWLAKYPKETVDIILKSARDLGAPGVDAVYGVGMLDVTAALSPLSYDRLTWYQMDDKGKAKPMSSSAVRASVGQASAWEAKGMYFTAFETIGGSYRDFLIPLSSKLVDSKALSAGLSKEQFQAYLYNQAIDWMKKGAFSASRPSLNYTAVSAPVIAPGDLNLTMSLAPRTMRAVDVRRGLMPYQMAMRLADEDNRFALKFGQGDGAVELGNAIGFGRAADYDPARGGANPLLGMASGGAYGQFSYSFNPSISMSVGVTEQSTRYRRNDMGQQELITYRGLDGYRAGASTVGLTYRPAAGVELTGSYTRLRESDAVLGIQALSSEVLDGGSTTQGMTFGASYSVSPTLRLAVAATMGRTTSSSASALVATGAGGFRSTAYQLTLSKQQLFGRNDALRLSIAQPLHVEKGSLDVSSVQVIDRELGTLGLVTERFALAGSRRPLVAEAQYGRTVMDGRADLSLFGKARLRGDAPADQLSTLMTGARFTFRY